MNKTLEETLIGKTPDNFDRFCVTPRGKAKFKIHYGIHDYYKYYKQTVTLENFTSKFANPSTGLIVDVLTYKNVLNDYFELISQRLTSNPEPINIPYLGVLYTKKIKMNFKNLIKNSALRIDYKTSKQLNKLVYFTNDTRGNHFYKMTWLRSTKKNPLYAFYQLRFLRCTKRRLASVLLNNPKIDFFEKGK